MRIARASRVSDALGRQVDETERASVGTFNELSVAMVAEARHIRNTRGRLDTCEYLSFFVGAQHEGDAEAFCEDVIENGQAAATWRIADLLCGGHELRREGIRWTTSEYRSSFEGLTGERWFRTISAIEKYDRIPPADTGPGVVYRGTRYWTQRQHAPGPVPLRYTVIDSTYEVIERVSEEQLDIQIRRWMTSTAAWWANKYLTSEGPRATLEGVITAYPGAVEPSADGLVAIRALVREAKSGDPRWPGQVGFIGPDEWYRP